MSLNINNLPEITSSKLFLDRNYAKIDPNGILSEVVFGPKDNYKCSCGNYNSKSLYAGLTCPKCNVICTTNDLRYKNFAKINLLIPVIKKQKQDAVIKIIKRKYKNLIDPIQADLSISVKAYMEYDDSIDSIKLVDTYNDDCVPLAITGLYSLYICFFILSDYYGSSLACEVINDYFTQTVLVTPPDTRSSLVTNNKGTMTLYKSTIDELYVHLLKIQTYNKDHYSDIIDTNIYYKMVVINIENGINIPIEDDTIKLIDGIASYFQYFCTKIYDNINSLLSGKYGLIRRNLLGKSIDFSSRAVVTCDPALLGYQIRLPKLSFIKLFFLDYARFLKIEKHIIIDRLKLLIKKSEIEDITKLDHVDEFIEYFFKRSQLKQRLLILNRVPSLWRHSCPIVEVAGVNEDNIISVSPMIIEPMNMDKESQGPYKIS
jgi:DNA-directed RNA polymerase beta' subunit